MCVGTTLDQGDKRPFAPYLKMMVQQLIVNIFLLLISCFFIKRG